MTKDLTSLCEACTCFKQVCTHRMTVQISNYIPAQSQLIAYPPKAAANRVSVPRLPAFIQKKWTLRVFLHQPSGQLDHLRSEDHDPTLPCLALRLVLIELPNSRPKINVISCDLRNFARSAARLIQGEQEIPKAIARRVAVKDALSIFGREEPLASLRRRLLDLLQRVRCDLAVVEGPIERPLERHHRTPATSLPALFGVEPRIDDLLGDLGRSQRPVKVIERDQEHLVPLKSAFVVVLAGPLEKCTEDVPHPQSRRGRKAFCPLGHHLCKESVGILFSVPTLGRRTPAEFMLPALVALAHLHHPPTVVFAEERFLRHGKPSRSKPTW